VDVILDAAGMEMNIVEREGVSCKKALGTSICNSVIIQSYALVTAAINSGYSLLAGLGVFSLHFPQTENGRGLLFLLPYQTQ